MTAAPIKSLPGVIPVLREEARGALRTTGRAQWAVAWRYVRARYGPLSGRWRGPWTAGDTGMGWVHDAALASLYFRETVAIPAGAIAAAQEARRDNALPWLAEAAASTLQAVRRRAVVQD